MFIINNNNFYFYKNIGIPEVKDTLQISFYLIKENRPETI